MTPMTLRGLPVRLMTDGWWLDQPAGPKGPAHPGTDRPAPPPQSRIERLALLALLIAAGDALLLQVWPGLSLAVFALLVLLAATAANDGRGAGGIGLGLLFLLPLVEQVQPLSVALAALGTLVGLGWIGCGGWRGLARTLTASLRLVEAGPLLILRDLRGLAALGTPANPRGLATLARGWAVPVGLGLIFAALLADANPMLSRALAWAHAVHLPSPQRVLAWLGLAWLVWPSLRLAAMTQRLAEPLRLPDAPLPPAIVNAASVRRSLVLFNALFALQTLSDLAYLWLGATLPEGMSYAQYAHSGAYPLLVAALLAGGFALIARPFVAQDRLLRAALMFWVAQCVLLVLSSILRLDLYVEAYGLTRLRLAAFFWMGTVTLGLGLLIWQIARHHSAAWLLTRAAALGLATLWLASLISFDARIARDNLAKPARLDVAYLCALGPAAQPAIAAFEKRAGRPLCHRFRAGPTIPQDWRKWGFRNARTRSSLALLSTGTH